MYMYESEQKEGCFAMELENKWQTLIPEYEGARGTQNEL